MDHKELVTTLVDSKRMEDLLILSRYMYRSGEPIISDALYEKLVKMANVNGFGGEYLARTYDDDPIPRELLQEFSLTEYLPAKYEERLQYYRALDADKSLSIRAVTEMHEAHEFGRRIRGQRTVMSLKTDGVFTKALYLPSEEQGWMEMKLALSRGRSGNAWDFTDALSMKLPQQVKLGTGELRVYSEAYAETLALEYLSEKYDPSKFKTEKSSAISMLRVPKDIQDYQHLRTLTFAADGIGTKLSENLAKCKELGFEVMPHIVIEPEEVPAGEDEFVEWLRGKLDKLWELKLYHDVPADGVVWEVDDQMWDTEQKGQYASRNIALKMEQWSFEYYVGTVIGMEDDQRRVNGSCVLLIDPVVANDRTVAKRINGFNLGILQENGIKKGTRIYFERNSGAVNILIHGGRLKKVERELVEED